MLRVAVLAASFLAATGLPALADPWTFTDGSGKTVALDDAPTRIIASQDAAAALIPLGIRPVGIYAYGPVAQAKALQGLDLSGIEILSEVWGEVDIEKAAALEPDLVIDEYWPVSNEWGGGNDLVATFAPLAPMTGVTVGESTASLIADYESLAAGLGAAPSEAAVADKAAFEASRAAFVAATEAKPNLTALAVSTRADAMYVATPVGSTELSDFVAWGLDIVPPEKIDARGYFEALSWENVDKYQVDLIIVDNRSASYLETALAQPTWTTLKAAEAGSVAEWPAYWLRNYRAYAVELDKLTAAINAADENLTE